MPDLTTNESTPSQKRDTTAPAHTNVLGITGPIPKWLPVSFLAISSVALIVPFAMLRRYKASIQTTRNVNHHHGASPSLSASDVPPRRRRAAFSLPGSRIPTSPASQAPPPPRVRLRGDLPSPPPLRTGGVKLPPGPGMRLTSVSARPTLVTPNMIAKEEDGFNAPLYTLKALTVATALVATCASATVVGVVSYLGVRDTSEFAASMRLWMISTFPVLSERIHRQLEPTDHKTLAPLFPPNNTIPDSYSHSADTRPVLVPATSSSTGISTPSGMPDSCTSPAFDIAEAQARLAAAYERGGFYTWGEAAIKELEAEAEADRRRRQPVRR